MYVIYAQVFIVLIPRDPIKSAPCGNVKDKAHIFSANVKVLHAPLLVRMMGERVVGVAVSRLVELSRSAAMNCGRLKVGMGLFYNRVCMVRRSTSACYEAP